MNPDIWQPGENGEFNLAAMAADPDARQRGGSQSVNPRTLEAFTDPWADGSGDRVTTRVLPPEGVTLGTPEETEYGWRVPMSNGWLAEVTSLFETRWMAYLGSFMAPGVKTLFWIPKAAVVDSGDGWWRPKRIEITMRGAFDLDIQPYTLEEMRAVCAQASDTQDPFVFGSATVYATHKRHNGPECSYMTGKVQHYPAPAAIFWKEGRFLGRVVGRLEKLGPGMLVKAWRVADIAPYLAACDWVSIDSTHGYTSIGTAQSQTWAGHYQSGGALPAGNWLITKISAVSGNAHGTNDYWAAVYNANVVDYPGNILANSLSAKQAMVGNPAVTEFVISASVVGNGSTPYGCAIQGSNGNGFEMRWDGGGVIREYANWPQGTYYTYGQSPYDANAANNGFLRATWWFTYGLAGGLLLPPGMTGGMAILTGGMRG